MTDSCGAWTAVMWSSLAAAALIGFVTALVVTRRLVK